MDKETREFIESQNKALLEDMVGVIKDMGAALEARIDKQGDALRKEMKDVESSLRQEIGAVALEMLTMKQEMLEVKQLVSKIDERTQHQVEALYEEVRVTQKAVARVEDRLGLPQSFPVAA